MSRNQAMVKNLFRKYESKAAMLPTKNLRLDCGWGIMGDLNRDPLSLRQILLTSLQKLDQLSIPPGELRENIVLDLAHLDCFQPGTKLTFASAATIRLTFYCEPYLRKGIEERN